LIRGRKIDAVGTAPSDNISKVQEFNDSMRKAPDQRAQALFVKVNAPTTTLQPGGQLWNWSFSCELKRTDTE